MNSFKILRDPKNISDHEIRVLAAALAPRIAMKYLLRCLDPAYRSEFPRWRKAVLVRHTELLGRAQEDAR